MPSRAPGLDSSTLTTNVTFNPANNQKPGSTVNVAVTYNFTPIAPYIPAGTMSLKSTSQMVIIQ